MKYKFLILTIIIASLGSSCTKWLDIQPETDVAADELFGTQEGFFEALNGLYSRSTSGDIYGNELSFGLLDVLAQNYSIPTFDPFRYRPSANFNYNDELFIARSNGFWSGLYGVISNCNLLLEKMEDSRELFTGNNYELIKGEALALRAYMHFDLLRLYAPAYGSDPAASAIPYVTEFSNKVTPLSTVSTCMDKIVDDLQAAKTLLAEVDPIIDPAYVVGYSDDDLTTEEEGNQLFVHNRRHRMNYYAVCGTLARVFLYKEDKPAALSNALIVIQSQKFPWTMAADFQAPDEEVKDRILYKELVFAWYIPGSLSALNNLFNSGTNSLTVDENAGLSIYETAGVGAEDLRFKEWLRLTADASGRRFQLMKYRRNQLTDNEEANRHPLMAPAIRLSEMYYIAAECTYTTNPTQAIEYFNEVRFNRGIGTSLVVANEQEFIAELVKECRKEWFGESQIFYMYKRLHRAIPTQTGGQIPASNDIFVFPFPVDEIAFGGRD